MKKLSLLCLALAVGLSTTAAFARGGGGGMGHGMGAMGMHGGMPMSSGLPTSGGLPVTGGAFGTNPATPGTNSLGTALSSSGIANGPQKGPLLGTDPSLDPEEAKVEKMIGSICRGC
ncbi:hypothetical protein AAFX91_20970 [Bradyrhizobium sp. 31Argb]|uniref:hypothetical protein n=1 Tax=unclassified Bradyrhizobium TaxID=2631580 RepID=UPI00102EBB5F|nr:MULTISPECIES: hypothetical protein [unclassified Bradyrhizobium]MDI4238024.1 hypothetical protein [Bradyrhizobium sp. Arg237L]TAI62797.1 hypothetical protein CWO89_27760 [Bradyrhizobium sp. Leo170]